MFIIEGYDQLDEQVKREKVQYLPDLAEPLRRFFGDPDVGWVVITKEKP